MSSVFTVWYPNSVSRVNWPSPCLFVFASTAVVSRWRNLCYSVRMTCLAFANGSIRSCVTDTSTPKWLNYGLIRSQTAWLFTCRGLRACRINLILQRICYIWWTNNWGYLFSNERQICSHDLERTTDVASYWCWTALFFTLPFLFCISHGQLIRNWPLFRTDSCRHSPGSDQTEWPL